MVPDARKYLKQYWTYEAFRPFQEEIISSILAGKDVLALLPTGGGKSICYQVPALMKEGFCLVVSPLIALMQDQVSALKDKGIPAEFLHSGLSKADIQRIMDNAIYGSLKLLYVSPERLESGVFQNFLKQAPIHFVAIDEAHCISQWGYDFRPSYGKLASLREWLNCPVMALTATATEDVRRDIIHSLRLKEPLEFVQSFRRENISIVVEENEQKPSRLISILRKFRNTNIVYARSRREVVNQSNLLRMEGISADYYHAGLLSQERKEKLEHWLAGSYTMVSTNAFGMGIDKPDVRMVVHLDLPPSLEEYYQEIGRAGRDGQKSYAVMLYDQDDRRKIELRFEAMFPDFEQVKSTFTKLCNDLQFSYGDYSAESFDFDSSGFATKYQIAHEKLTYILQILQQSGWIELNDSVFSPSKLQIIASKTELEELDKMDPLYSKILEYLMRNYEGVFTLPVSIYELQVAKYLHCSVVELVERLKQLDRQGMIRYRILKNLPQIRFLRERPHLDIIDLDMGWFVKKRKMYRARFKSVLNFLDEKSCRQGFLLSYFGEKSKEDCGICDNCLRLKNDKIPMEIWSMWYNEISVHIRLHNQITVREVYHFFPSNKRHWVDKILQELIGEQKVIRDLENLRWNEK